MESHPLALLLAVVVAGVVLVRRQPPGRHVRRRAARRAVTTACPPSASSPSALRGSGKTLLLASMYHQMQTWGGRGYFLAAPREQVALLNHWFTEVEDPGRDWPAGTATADTREFTFDVRTRGGSGALHTVLKLSYLDYAGTLLTQPPEPGSTLWKDLDDRIESADALVAVIDGHRVRQWLDGRAGGADGPAARADRDDQPDARGGEAGHLRHHQVGPAARRRRRRGRPAAHRTQAADDEPGLPRPGPGARRPPGGAAGAGLGGRPGVRRARRGRAR